MGFTALDYVIVLVYLIGVAIFGVLSGGKQTSTRDYFLGSQRIPWWAICFAIVATETSALTFISIPGLAYTTNLNFLQITFGYILGRIVIAFLLLPFYFKGELVTAYALLTKRFGDRTRNLASIVFLFTRTTATGVRLYATAIPLAIILCGYQMFMGLSNESVYVISIVVITGFTFLYTYTGGMRAVIWTDVIQMFIYLGGAAVAMVVLLSKLPNGWESVVAAAEPHHKFQIFYSGFEGSLAQFFKVDYNFFSSVIGGAFLSMASHGADQLIVQRLLATNSLKNSQKALIGSGFIVMLQFLFFLLIGVTLYAFYQGKPFGRGDEVFPAFIIHELPTGISGLIIAGLFASAMGALSGSINSLASSTLIDLYKPYFGKHSSPERDLHLSKVFSIVWTIALMGTAFLFIMQTSQAVVEIALKIASITYGGLLGTFFLGILFKKPKEIDAIVGFLAGVAILVFLFIDRSIAWTWWTFIGCATTIIVGNLMVAVRKKM